MRGKRQHLNIRQIRRLQRGFGIGCRQVQRIRARRESLAHVFELIDGPIQSAELAQRRELAATVSRDRADPRCSGTGLLHAAGLAGTAD